MATFPGWLKATDPVVAADGLRLTLHCRPAHPSFLVALWRFVTVRPRVAKPFVVLAIWLRLLRRGG